MGNLGDELFKAGLLKKKDLKRIQHEERVEGKIVSRDALEKKTMENEQVRDEARAQVKKRDRDMEEVKQQRRRQKEEKHRLSEQIRRAKIQESGPRRFYFITRSGSIPFIAVSDRLGKRLEHGECAIVEVKSGKVEEFAIVPSETARAVAAVNPDTVRFLNARSDFSQ